MKLGPMIRAARHAHAMSLVKDKPLRPPPRVKRNYE
jgi:hypothetical protein